jgi:hypothetical protein
MKTLHWNAINPLTGEPFKWGDPNLRWGSPSYYLEPGDPGFVPYANTAPPPPEKHKPFRHARKPDSTSNNTNSNTPMSTFNYNVVPKNGGGFSTRPALGNEYEEATIDAAVATITGVTADKCAAVLGAYFDQFLLCAGTCGWSHDFHGVLSIRPTSGGSQLTPDGFNNAQEINAGVSLAISPDRLDTWRAGLSIHSEGQVGRLAPEVDSIINLADGTEDTYTPLQIIQLSGSHLDFDKTDVTQGVFYATAAAPGTKVRIAAYGPITPGQINAITPAGVTGQITITVTTKMTGTLRSTTYLNPIG